MPYGFFGRVLRVNLSAGTPEVLPLDEAWFRAYLGGWGLVAYVLLTEVPADCDPLGPENKLIIAAGLMTGAPLGGAGRNIVGAKSPLTGGFGASEVGGFFGAELRRAGWDGIIVEGQAERPVYLWIRDDQVELRDAAHLWGRPTAEVEEALKAELEDERVRVCQIGPAGERLCLNACVLNDVHHAAGRCGLGAVMGAKKLRAVAVRGTGTLPLANPDVIRKWARWQADLLAAGDPVIKLRYDYGTPGFLPILQASGGLPTRNFREGVFEGAERIDGQHMAATILKGGGTCFACPVRCKRIVETHDEWQVQPAYGGPEYETIAAFGSLCGVDDLSAIAKANELCNTYGLDTISAGATIAWAMECFERGLLTTADTDGIPLNFGNARAVVQMLEKIIQREGFGDILAQGAYRAAQIIGRGTEQYVLQVKKQEVPMHDPRIKFALDLGYATSPTGADHVHNLHDNAFQTPENIAGLRPLGIHRPLRFDDLSPAKVRMARRWITYRTFQNCLGMCIFMSYSIEAQQEIVRALTGWDFSIFEMLEVGERVLAMARVFTARCGLRAADDAPPARFFEPLGNGPLAGSFIPPDAMRTALQTYYQMMGWDPDTGAPLPWKLHELDLGWLPEAGTR
jgi:aldehyde:ferredoxin oxidoreductase